MMLQQTMLRFSAGFLSLFSKVFLMKQFFCGRLSAPQQYLMYVVAFLFAFIVPLAAQDGSPGFCFSVERGFDTSPVRGMVQQPDGKLVVVGSFSRYNDVARVGIARFNTDGTLDSTKFVDYYGNPSAVALQPDGKILVSSANSFVRYNSNGTLDPTFASLTFNAGGAGTGVQVIAVQSDGKILIGGSFDGYGGDPTKKRIARLNSDGSIDNTFNVGYPQDDGNGTTTGFVKDIAIQPDGKILVGGDYKLFNATTFYGPGPVTRLNSDGSVDNTFTPASLSKLVSRIRLKADGKIVLLLHPYIYGGSYGQGEIVQLNANGTLDAGFTGWISSADGTFLTYDYMDIQPDGKILVSANGGGGGGAPGGLVARLNVNGSLDPTFTKVVGNSGVYTFLRLTDGNIVVGGSFDHYSWYQQDKITKLDANGSILPGYFHVNTGFLDIGTFPSAVKSYIKCMVQQPDGKLIVGGVFQSYNDVARDRWTRFNADGTLDSTKFNGYVGNPTAVGLQPDGKILVAGTNGFLRFNSNGTVDPTFTSGINPAGGGGGVNTIVVQSDGKILIGGGFQAYGNDPSKNAIARLNSDGTLDNTFASEFYNTGSVTSIVIQPDGKFLVGGQYATWSTSQAHYPGSVTRLNSNGTVDNTFIAAKNTGVYQIRLQADGKVLCLTGTYGGLYGHGEVYRLNTNGALDASFTGWTYSNNDGTFPTYDYMDIQPDGKILVTANGGGGGGAPGGLIARLNTDGSLDPTFTKVVGNGAVYSFVQRPDGNIVVGGSFDHYSWYQQDRITCLTGTPASPPTAAYSNTIFPEATVNNGSITTSNTITLGGTTWTSSVANGNPLVAGTHYTVANVPAGLTMVLTKNSASQVQISFTGNATAHANANDVSNVQITFLNTAVQNGNAAIVSGLNGQNLTIDFADPAILPPTISCTSITSTGGNVVLINGTRFTGTTSVKFGGVNAQSFTVNSATQITATVAFGSTSGSYTVTTPGGTASCAMFTYIPTPPIIKGFNPAYGVNPQNVTITGANFLGTTQVTFGGVTATLVSVTDTKIVATLGVGTISSTPVVVAVTKPDGTATLAGFVYSDVPPIPNITSFSPTCGTTGTVITISGTGLSGVKSVKLGGTPAPFIVVSDYEISATVKTGATGAITVTSLSGTHSLPGFIYNPLPTITGFVPNNPDAGQTLIINGTNFIPPGCGVTVQSLYLGGQLVPPGNITVVSTTAITVVVPANASSGTVQLIRTDNSNATRTGFLFNAPRPISFTPTSGTTGTAVVITGQNFSGTSGAAGVKINGVNAAFYTVDSDTQITAYPAASSATTGSIVVTNVNGNGSAGTFTFTPPAIIDGFYTSYGATGATITLYGRNFTNAFLVKFGTKVGSIVSVSPTQIVATVGTGAGTSGPTVSTTLATTTPGGQGVRSGFRFSTGPTVAAPTISSITPQPVAQQNTVLSINGTNLLTATGVLLNGVPLQFSGTPTNALVKVIIPAGSTDGTITVYTHGGTTTSSVTILPLPTILSFTPSTGATGTMVTITGSGFTGVTGAASVRFGSTNAASYTVLDNTHISAIVAGGATGVITIVAPGGTVTSTTNYTYVAPVPAPTITSVSTDIGTTGTVITINGTNFVNGSTNVSFGGTAASNVTFVSATQIKATVGTGNSGNIIVTTPSGSANSNAALGVNFTYLPHPIPTITSFNTSGNLYGYEGDPVIIVGNYLAGTSRITIGGALVTTFVVNTNGSITATVPAGAITGKIIIYKDVVSPTNTLIAQSAADYTVLALFAFNNGGNLTSGESQQAVLAGVSSVSPSGMTLFPNPVESTVTVQTTFNTSGVAKLSLVNALGATVWTAEMPVQAGAFEREIEVSNLPSGFYMTELRMGTERLTKRFVKR
jgi:uncharacterized delta-60 repeat protein